MKKNILIGITGGISAYKILDLIRILKKDNFNIKVIMTYSAQKIMPASAIKKLGIEVHNDMFGKNFNYKKIIKNQRIDHIDLGRFADLVIVAPATANIIAKLAGGFADDLLTATLLATIKPVFIYPSMNTNMWLHPSVQKNIRILSQLNYHIINPESGKLACDSVGIGRLPEVKDIYQDIKDHLNDSSRLKGKKVISIDLNPLSRSAQKATITIVDNIVRALPTLIQTIKKMQKKERKYLIKIINGYNNRKILNESIKHINSRLKQLTYDA